MENKYNVWVLGADKPLTREMSLTNARNHRVRWAAMLTTETIIIIDNTTGEVIEGL